MLITWVPHAWEFGRRKQLVLMSLSRVAHAGRSTQGVKRYLMHELEDTSAAVPYPGGAVAVQHVDMRKHAERCKWLVALAPTQGHTWHVWEVLSGVCNFAPRRAGSQVDGRSSG